MKKRVILIVLDSAGIGAMPDAAEFGDTGSNTIGNICRVRGKLDVPNMDKLGLAHIKGSTLPIICAPTEGSFGRLAERTKAKDTTSGHWEMAGLSLDTPFRTYPNGFPDRIIREFEQRIGRKVLGNCVASGTQIIQELGDEHVRTGSPIVYTSADSVFQVAAHEEVIPLAELYRICEIAREMLHGDDLVGRVIARPFLGSNGNYTRTENRRDYAIEPTKDTILDALTAEGLETVGVGKIEDIFCKRGITTVDHTKNNETGTAAAQRFIDSGEGSFVFVNLVDFDMLYGHRNDVEGYGKALETFDTALPALRAGLKEDDILMITADHGCDPTTPSTDHSREYIPLLITGTHVRKGHCIGTRDTFADIGATVYEYLTGKQWREGSSFLREIWED